jgi:hypothetical protein
MPPVHSYNNLNPNILYNSLASYFTLCPHNLSPSLGTHQPIKIPRVKHVVVYLHDQVHRDTWMSCNHFLNYGRDWLFFDLNLDNCFHPFKCLRGGASLLFCGPSSRSLYLDLKRNLLQSYYVTLTTTTTVIAARRTWHTGLN